MARTSVTTGQIRDGQVGAADLADGAVQHKHMSADLKKIMNK